jgi:hypothetical protein
VFVEDWREANAALIENTEAASEQAATVVENGDAVPVRTLTEKQLRVMQAEMDGSSPSLSQKAKGLLGG